MPKSNVVLAHYPEKERTLEFGSVKKCAAHLNVPMQHIYRALAKNGFYIHRSLDGYCEIQLKQKVNKWKSEKQIIKISNKRLKDTFRYEMVDIRQRGWVRDPAVTTAISYKYLHSIMKHRFPCTIGQVKHAVKNGYFKPYFLLKKTSDKDVAWSTIKKKMDGATGRGRGIAVYANSSGTDVPYRSIAAASRATGITWWEIYKELKARDGYAVIKGVIFKIINKGK